jgi:hypothetical protein
MGPIQRHCVPVSSQEAAVQFNSAAPLVQLVTFAEVRTLVDALHGRAHAAQNDVPGIPDDDADPA